MDFIDGIKEKNQSWKIIVKMRKKIYKKRSTSKFS